MKLLELFAGSRSIGEEGVKLGMDVFSVDYHPYDNINLVIDIYKIEKKDIPFIPDVIWASPDCTTYSIAACGTHRNHDKTAKSEYANQCDTGNQHWISLMNEYLEINPDMVFFIENPRGILRHMEFMQEFTRYTVWYCQYGDKYEYIDENGDKQVSIRAKPTDIWTNSKTWKPRPMCKNYKYNKETGDIIDRHCNHDSARRGAKTGTQGRKNAHERSKIPRELCIEVLNSTTNTNQGQTNK